MSNKKCFIDPKRATKFNLVHRSQKDPLIVDESLGQHVLQPIIKVSDEDGEPSIAPAPEEVIEERQKLGIYYKDDYDYLKHLKNVGEVVDVREVDRTIIRLPASSVQLPSTIFETQGVELKVGLLNQAAHHNELLPEVDPDIAAALDGDCELGDDLEDDFFEKANEGDDDDPLEVCRITDGAGRRNDALARFGLIRDPNNSDSDSNDEEGEGGSHKQHLLYMDHDQESDRRSRFTNYSMSSAVIKRPDGLQIIDEHFETLYEEYDEERLGDVDAARDTITGFVAPDSARFQQLVDEEHARLKRKYIFEKPTEEIKASILSAMDAKQQDAAGGNEKEEMVEILVDVPGSKKARWDCESVISMGSNIFNHPTLIKEPSKRAAKQAQKEAQERARTEKDIGSDHEMTPMDTTEDDEVEVESSTNTASTFRPKGETAEERRLRKHSVKHQRRERRAEKKQTKEHFKEVKKEVDLLRSRTGPAMKTRPLK